MRRTLALLVLLTGCDLLAPSPAGTLHRWITVYIVGEHGHVRCEQRWCAFPDGVHGFPDCLNKPVRPCPWDSA